MASGLNPDACLTPIGEKVPLAAGTRLRQPAA